MAPTTPNASDNALARNDLERRLMALRPEGWTNADWAREAGLSRQAFTDLKKRGSLSHKTIGALLTAAGRSWAEFDATQGSTSLDAKLRLTDTRPAFATKPADLLGNAVVNNDLPRDIPVFGTAEGAARPVDDDGKTILTDAMTMDQDEVVEYRLRPSSLIGKRNIYALYVVGDSMAPWKEAGELIYIDGNRAPAINDYVVIQCRNGFVEHADEHRIVRTMVKRLVRRSSTWVELQQYNPPQTFRIATDTIERIHRVMRLDELV